VSGLQLSLAQGTLAAFLMATARTAGFVLTAPPFNTRSVPSRIRAIVALALAIPLTVWMRPTAPSLTSIDLVLQGVLQIVVGAAFGFVVLLAVSTLQVIGDFIDVIGGFSMTMALDPLQLVQSSVMGRLHQLIAVTLLFAADGHLMIIQGFARGMQVMPLPVLDPAQLAKTVSEGFVTMFAAAFQVALPVIVVMIVADISLGLLTRVAPALNAFALSFPLKLVLSLLLISLIVRQLPDVLATQVTDAVEAILHLAGAG